MLALVGAVYTGKDALASRLVLFTAALFVVMALWIWQPGARAKVPLAACSQDDALPGLQSGDFAVCRRCPGDGTRLYARTGLLRFEYPLLVAFSVVGHDGDGLRRRLDGALHGP